MPTYPNVSTTGALLKMFEQLRTNFPQKVNAEYLQKFQIAPANESYVIAVLRFLGLIDDEGNQRGDRVGFFYGNEEGFRKGMDGILREAYADLFADMGDAAYTTPRDSLSHWFRVTDKTSELVGKRQAGTFLALASLTGSAEAPRSVGNSKPRAAKAVPRAEATAKAAAPAKSAGETAKTPEKVPVRGHGAGVGSTDVGLTVRIEVNLPAGGDADTYDAIFASIKRHLIP